MVRDGYYYALACLGRPSCWLVDFAGVGERFLLLLGAFFLWFFRDPDRQIPADGSVIVSPADGKVTDVSQILLNGERSHPHQYFSERVQCPREPLADLRHRHEM